jgi:hypothetical protein
MSGIPLTSMFTVLLNECSQYFIFGLLKLQENDKRKKRKHRPLNNIIINIEIFVKNVVKIGLDISSSVIGIALNANETITLKHINLKKFNNLFEKSKYIEDNLDEFFPEKCDEIYVEDFAKKFSPGFSSAATITTLSSINFIVSYFTYRKYNTVPQYVNVNTARKKLSLLAPPKTIKGTERKKFIFNQMKDRYPTLNWLVKTNGEYHSVNYDMADALIVLESQNVIL